MNIRFLLIIIPLLMSGCATMRPVVQRIQFPVEEYELLQQEGTAIVCGQAFMKTRGGDVKLAAGNEVLLNPVTSYSEQWFEETYLQNKDLSLPDLRYRKHILSTIADAEGSFEFKNVPPGEYYLTTRVIWEAPVGYHGSLVPQGGLLAERITVKNGDELRFILTR